MCFFLQSYRGFVSKYRGLFGKSNERSEGVDTERSSERTEQQKHLDYWSWYVTLDNLSGKDRTKWDYFLNLPIIQFLNLLSYHIDHSEEVRRAASEKSRL